MSKRVSVQPVNGAMQRCLCHIGCTDRCLALHGATQMQRSPGMPFYLRSPGDQRGALRMMHAVGHKALCALMNVGTCDHDRLRACTRPGTFVCTVSNRKSDDLSGCGQIGWMVRRGGQVMTWTFRRQSLSARPTVRGLRSGTALAQLFSRTRRLPRWNGPPERITHHEC